MATIMHLEVTGIEEILRRLEVLQGDPAMGLARGLYRWGNEVMEASQQEVPRDTGNLAGTGLVQQPVADPQGVSMELGYGGPAAPYALVTHENPRAGKTGGWGPKGPQEVAFRWIKRRGKRWLAPIGAQREHWATVGKWKYLEDPFKRFAPFLNEVVAEELNIYIQQVANAVR